MICEMPCDIMIAVLPFFEILFYPFKPIVA